MIARIFLQYLDRKGGGGVNGITNIAIYFYLLTYAVTLKHLPSSRNYGDK